MGSHEEGIILKLKPEVKEAQNADYFVFATTEVTSLIRTYILNYLPETTQVDQKIIKQILENESFIHKFVLAITQEKDYFKKQYPQIYTIFRRYSVKTMNKMVQALKIKLSFVQGQILSDPDLNASFHSRLGLDRINMLSIEK